MKTAAIYLRVSTEEQAREGYSIDAQLKAIKKYALNNEILVDNNYIYKDEGISGRKAEKRPAFMEMIKQAKSKDKKFDVILVHKFDRFSRNREDSVVYKSLLKKEYGIPVISISEPLDPDDKMSVIMEAFLEAMAEYYSLNLSGEVKKGQIEKHSKGEFQTRPCYGYKVYNNTLIEDDEESKIVKLIFELFGYEHNSMMKITKKLYSMNIKNKNGKNFENRNIYYILNNPTYIGKLRYTPGQRNTRDFSNPNTIIVSGKHKPIIPLNLWNAVQDELVKNNKWKKPHQKIDDNPKHWIKGLVRCKECGCTMVTCGKYKIRCNGYNKGKCFNNKTLYITDVQSLIISKIKEDIESGIIKNIATSGKTKKTIDEYTILKNKLDQLLEKELRVKEAYMNGIDNIDEYKENKNIIARERVKLEKELKTKKMPDNSNHKKEIIENGKKVYEILNNGNISIKEKNEIAHILINKLEYDSLNETLSLYYN